MVFIILLIVDIYIIFVLFSAINKSEMDILQMCLISIRQIFGIWHSEMKDACISDVYTQVCVYIL
jgi:hypothetical protein